MKFLLVAINAKFIHVNPAVYSLREAAGRWKPSVSVSEYTINQPRHEILADIAAAEPDVIGVSCYIWNREVAEALIRELAIILPNVPLWVGGPEVSYNAPDVFRAMPALTGIMVGEGEAVFRDLANYYGTGATGSLTDIRGLYLPGNPPVYTGDREAVDPDSLPFLYGDPSRFENRILYYESGRGCPFRCSYCLSSLDKTVRFRSLDRVFRELQVFLDAKVPQVKFVDRTFNCSHERSYAIWNYLKEHDNGITNWHCEVAADLLTDRELDLLESMRPGLVQLEIGVQTTNPETLRAIHRTTDEKRLREVTGRILEAGNIHMHLDLIAGLPYEDSDSFRRSFDDVFSMKPNQLQLGFLKVLRGTEMEAEAVRYGISYSPEPPYEVLRTKWLSFADICHLKQVEEMLELYYNSGQFVHTMKLLVKSAGSPFRLFEGLAAYYEKNGLRIHQPSRMYRYDALLGYASETDPTREELYRNLLTYDLYLRENVKQRPAWAVDRPDRDTVRRTESGTLHTERFDYPVWSDEPERRLDVPQLIRLDYSERDPLTYNAKTEFLREDREDAGN